MNFTAKSRYALKIMIDLAIHSDQGVQQREDIALRAGIPSDFMDQITVKLKARGLIESVRGRRGGYRLAKHSEKISAFDIFSAVEGDAIQPVACLQSELECDKESSCLSRFAWNKIYTGVTDELSRHSLYDLVASVGQRVDVSSLPTSQGGRRECLPPKRTTSVDSLVRV
jgi:Rrf2 family protein